MRLIAWLVSLLSLHAAVNRWRRDEVPFEGPVSVLVPARDEAHRIAPLLRTLPRDVEVLVLDDHSSDGTADLVRAQGFTVLDGQPLPRGWLGKPWACQQLADAATGDVLVFVDA
ncbi:MAG: family 2 glycosyl transferase, partial [Frankiales bacterium]|nr:family 2 glycosyl transferase [Frankiales bacterium]